MPIKKCICIFSPLKLYFADTVQVLYHLFQKSLSLIPKNDVPPIFI
jgi:hypothetical protein